MRIATPKDLNETEKKVIALTMQMEKSLPLDNYFMNDYVLAGYVI